MYRNNYTAKSMRKHLFLTTVFLYVCFFTNAQYTTTGTDFWLSFMQNFDDPENTQLYLTSDVAASGTASIPGTGWSQAFTIPANGSVYILIPTAQNAAIDVGNSVINKGVHITANHSIAVYAANQRDASSDATLVLPVHALGDTYRVTAYSPFSGQPSQFVIVGIQNNTSIQIIPSASVTGGVSANTPFTITLNTGQVYLVQSSGDLTGSSIKATTTGSCNNFAVFAGNQCANVPLTCTYCDHLYEQMIPIKAWGKEYITVPLMTRTGDLFRILASENSTTININGGAAINLNAGQFHETTLTPASFIIGNKPISVAQYSRGTSCDNVISDPFMIMLSPVEQTLTYINFQAFNTTAINQFYTNLVCKTPYTSTVQLDGAAVTGWTTVASNPAYSYARKTLSQGSHVVICPQGVLSTVYGFGTVESYGYLAGANIQPLNVSFDIIVDNDSISYDTFQDTLNCAQTSNGVGFYTTGTNVTNVHFDFGDGVTAVGNSVFHTYAAAGAYTVTMYFTRVGSCVEESLEMIVHASNALPPFNFINDTVVCNGVPFVINPGITGVNFHWQNNATTPTFNVTTTGTYALTISDNQGCSSSATADVTFVNLSTSITEQSISCNGFTDGELTAVPSGGNSPYLYHWSTSPSQTTATIINLGPGTYYVTVTDANSCTSSANRTLSVAASLNVTLSQFHDISCYNSHNGSVSITTSGGTNPYTIAWNPSSVNGFSPSGMLPGNYSYTVTDLNGCYGTNSFTMTNPAELVVTESLVQANCFGEAISATINTTGGTAPVTIVWQSGSTLFTNNNIPGNTNFNYTVTDANHCTRNGYVYLNSPPQLVINPTFNNIGCFGDANGSIQLNISGGVSPYSSTWNNSLTGASLSHLGPGSYDVTVSDSHNCSLTRNFIITQPAELTTTAISTNAGCFGEPVSASVTALGGTPPLTIAWQDGSTFFNNQNIPANTNFSFTVTDGNDCAKTGMVNLNSPAELIINSSYNNIRCKGEKNGSINISITGGVNPYISIWNIGLSGNSLNNLNPGNYIVTVHDANNCSVTKSFYITEAPFELSLNAIWRNATCYGYRDGSILLSATGGISPYNYNTSDGLYSFSESSQNGIPSGTYISQVTDHNGCIEDTTIIISQPEALSADYVIINPSCIGNNDGEIILNVYGGITPYSFRFGNNFTDTSLIASLIEGDYLVEITDSNECLLSLGRLLLEDKLIDCIKIPNAFTPNGDQVNDTWEIHGWTIFPDAIMRVYNRWGQPLYVGESGDPFWDGKYEGKNVPTGTYVYVLDVRHGKKIYKGVVTVVY